MNRDLLQRKDGRKGDIRSLAIADVFMARRLRQCRKYECNIPNHTLPLYHQLLHPRWRRGHAHTRRSPFCRGVVRRPKTIQNTEMIEYTIKERLVRQHTPLCPYYWKDYKNAYEYGWERTVCFQEEWRIAFQSLSNDGAALCNKGIQTTMMV